MELLNKVKKELEKNKNYDFSSEIWYDENLCILYDAVYTTENILKAENATNNGWIDANKYQPHLIDNEDYSEDVLAICNGQLMVMCYCYNPSEDESESGFFWSNCNGQIDGDAEFDDEYDVTFWQHLPSIVGFVA